MKTRRSRQRSGERSGQRFSKGAGQRSGKGAGAPDRDQILALLGEARSPMTRESIAEALGHDARWTRHVLKRVLASAEREGLVVCNRHGEYGLPARMDLVRGTVQGHRDGYGFVLPEDGSDDLFLSSRQMKRVMHGDRVIARVSRIDRRGRREGSLVEVLEHSTESVVGRVHREGGTVFVVPDNSRLQHDVLVPGGLGPASPGQMVQVRILEYPDEHTQPIGEITELLGERDAPGMATDIALRTHGIADEFGRAALAQARKHGKRIKKAAIAQRVDLRNVPLVTIDGADAKDFDDAVHCTATRGGWKLLVAIADVGAYVPIDSALDVEARARGTSVYFPDRVVPMLPETLSNGLCSLVPDEDRLCMACEMVVDHDGNVIRSRFLEAVMRSHARLTYDEVSAGIEQHDGAARERIGARLCAALEELYRLYHAFRRARDERGAMELDTAETAIVLDDAGQISAIEPRVRNDAHRLIEECMIAANVCAARFLTRRRLPGLYRVHDEPDADRVDELRAQLAPLGCKLGGGKRPRPRDYAALVDQVRDRPDAELIQISILRSLKQAVYSANCTGHFGLDLPRYAHFTSPIRRYPDLVVHRAIRFALAADPQSRVPAHGAADMPGLGAHCSMTERRADDASRDVVQRLKCEYARERVGEVHAGMVTGVAPFGLFVRLDGLHLDGLVHVSGLGPEYFHFDPQRLRLEGESTGRGYAAGDRLQVRISAVDVDDRKIDLELDPPPKRRGASRHPGRGRRGRKRRG